MNVPQESIEALPGVRVGDTYGPVSQAITAELNEQYLYAAQDYNPLYVSHGSAVQALVHPALLIHLNMSELLAFKPAAGWVGLHARDEVEMLGPVHVGETLTITWRVVELYEKRGRPYWVRETEVSDSHGRPLVRRRMHTAFVRRDES